jgi:hypothetical protein
MKNSILRTLDGRVEIEANKGKVFIIDYQDLELVSSIKNTWTATTNGLRATINKKAIFLHRFLMNPPEGKEVDHVNRNPLDNRRSNLRVCTHAENMKNRGQHDKNKKFKGVSYRDGSYIVRIHAEGKNKSFNFNNEDAAANCYNYYAKKYYGEYAFLNDCPDIPNWQDYRLTHKTNATSKYRGVSWAKHKWVSSIYYNKKQIRTYFEDEIEAARDYDKKVKEFGLDRMLNFTD